MFNLSADVLRLDLCKRANEPLVVVDKRLIQVEYVHVISPVMRAAVRD